MLHHQLILSNEDWYLLYLMSGLLAYGTFMTTFGRWLFPKPPVDRCRRCHGLGCWRCGGTSLGEGRA